MKPEKRDIVRFRHILDAIIKIQTFTEDVNEAEFRKNELIWSAV